MNRVFKKASSFLLAAAMVMTSIVLPPTKAEAATANAESAISVTVNKTTPVSQKVTIETPGDILLYKVTIAEAGAYAFYTTGSMDTEAYLLREDQLSTYPGEDYIKYNDDESGNIHVTSGNFYIRHMFTAGEVVYLAVNESGNDATGTPTVCMEYIDTYMEKDGICYEKIAGTSTWAVIGTTTSDTLMKAMIAADINGERVVEISDAAFSGLFTLYEVVIPEGITTIGDSAFDSTGLTEIKLPESCETIGADVFSYTLIEKIHLPKNVKSINVEFLPDYMKEITVAEDNADYKAIDGVLFSKDGKTLLRYPTAKKGDRYTVPSGTETIGNNAFYDTPQLSFIDLPQTVTSIEEKAFGAHSSRYRKFIHIVVRNNSCSIGTDATINCMATLYGLENSTAKTYAEGKDDVGFIALDPSKCKDSTHQLVTVKNLPTCETNGAEKQICLNCNYETIETTVTKLGHQTDEHTKNLCGRCGKVIDEEAVLYVTLQQAIIISEDDFTENGIDFIWVAYGFSLEKPGRYELSMSDKTLFEAGKITFLKETASNNLVEVIPDSNMEVILKEGEILWCWAKYDSNIDGVEIGIACKHAATEEKTTPAKCKEDGKVETVCTFCGEVVDTKPIEQTGHSVTEEKPICTLCGAYAQKDGICYEKITGTNTWAVVETTGEEITKAVIADKMNGESVVEIYAYAFHKLSALSEVVIPEGIKEIGAHAFDNTGLTEIQLPNSCETIGRAAFDDTGITKIHLPKSIKAVDTENFPSSLKKITVAEDNADYKSIDGVLFAKDNKTLLRYPPAMESDIYTVPSGTETIGDSAFYCTTKLNQVILPNSLKLIEEDAFCESSLCRIDCGTALETIKGDAFYSCDNLSFVDLPQATTFIGSYTFGVNSSSSGKEITIIIRNKDCEIKENITCNCKATLYGIESSTAKNYAEGKADVTFIALTSSGCDVGTHQMVKVTTVLPTCETEGKEKQICLNCDHETAETTVSKLGHQVDRAKNLCTRCMQIVNKDTIPYVTLQKSVTIKETDFKENETVFDGALYGFSLEKPGTYEVSISNESLWGTQLSVVKVAANESLFDATVVTDKKVVLKEGETLWLAAMKDSSVYNVEIGITCKHTAIEDKTTLATCQTEGKVEKVCASCGEVSKTTLIEKTDHNFAEKKPICTLCGAYAQKDGICYEKITGTNTWAVIGTTGEEITKAVIEDKMNGESVVKISESAFMGLSALSEVVIPEGIKEIEAHAFEFTGLTEIQLPKNIKAVDTKYFPSSLKKITVAEENADYKSIDGVLFAKDKKTLLRYPPAMESDIYTIPSGTETIGESAFYRTTRLNQVILPDSLKLMERDAFYRSSLCRIDCGTALETIKEGAFYYCDNLSFVDLPQATTFIGTYAFSVNSSSSSKEITIIIRNKDCEIKEDITHNCKATLYGIEGSTAKTYAEGKADVTFIALTSSGCKAGTHQMVKVTIVLPTCETEGKEKQICLNCDYETAETTVSKLGHQVDMAKNLCTRCTQIVNKDEIPYVTLQKSVTIKETDFKENETVFDGALYGFSLEKPGTYEVSISNESLWGTQLSIAKIAANESLFDATVITDKKIVLKEGETLWLAAMRDSSVYNVEIGIICKHTATEDKTTLATCQTEGKVEKVCTSCDAVLDTTPIPKTGHNFGDNEPMCTVCSTPNPSYKPTEPGKTEPTEPGKTEPTELGKTEPTEPDKTESTEPGKTEPTEPGKTEPTEPGKTEPTEPGKTEPTEPGKTEPTEPGKTEPTEPGKTELSDSGNLSKPQVVEIAKVTAKKKALKIKWKKPKTQTNGYELQISAKKNFKGAKKVTVKKNKITSVTVKKLKAKKKYYVRIRNYKMVKIDGKSKKLYSNWSKAITKKTK